MAEPSRSFAIKLNIDNDCRYLEKPKEKNMFRKKATPWVMAMAMMGMMGAIEAQTIDKNWVRQNSNGPLDAMTTIFSANLEVKNAKNFNRHGGISPGLSFFDGAAPFKDAYINAAKAVGAPHVDVVSSPTAPRTEQVCWETAAWIRTGNNGKAFNDAIVQEVAKQSDYKLNIIPGFENGVYLENACVNPRP